MSVELSRLRAVLLLHAGMDKSREPKHATRELILKPFARRKEKHAHPTGHPPRVRAFSSSF